MGTHKFVAQGASSRNVSVSVTAVHGEGEVSLAGVWLIVKCHNIHCHHNAGLGRVLRVERLHKAAAIATTTDLSWVLCDCHG